MKTVRGKHITVIGAARSGLAAARLLQRRGAKVFLSDSSPILDEIKQLLDRESIRWEENRHSVRALEASMAVVSPGVPDSAPVMEQLREKGVDIVSELEVASWFNRSPIVAVTGSNGKTTVTRWMEHTWKCAGRPCLVAGNIGTAFSDLVDRSSPDTTAILEVSSFQLDHIHRFRPDVSVILNITPDHLDRYGNRFEAYADSKWSITRNQTESESLIYNAEDPVIATRVRELADRAIRPRLLPFSAEKELERGAFVRNETIVINLNGNEEVLMPVEEVGLPGIHNLNNGLATALAARVSEIRNETIRESLQMFSGVEHRLETVRVLDGVRYVNDSKATNINAVWFALDSYNVPVVLILGGRDKGNDYRELEPQIREKVHTIVAIGEAKSAIREQLGEVVPNYLEAGDMKEAVRLCRKHARRGEVVLLSPACASFDMFRDFEERGNSFKKHVEEL